MKIGKPFNKFKNKEYYHCIDNYMKFTDFNILGLYRSLLENEQLSIKEKLDIRNYANRIFHKTFNFLQIKDPATYIQLNNLGLELTKADVEKQWSEVRENQKRILKQKRIKHRNFGIYSKHECGIEHCNYNGLMIKQGSVLAESRMNFSTDKNKNSISKKKEEERIFKKYRGENWKCYDEK